MNPALSSIRAPNQRWPWKVTKNLGYELNLKENEGLGMEILETRTDIPILTIPRLPKIERGVAAV